MQEIPYTDSGTPTPPPEMARDVSMNIDGVASLLDVDSDDENDDENSIVVSESDDCSERGRVQHSDSSTNTPIPSEPRADGLRFNMNRPWERSLLRQFEMLERKEQSKHAKAGLMFLGHTESRDFGVEAEFDNVSLDTTGSAVPQTSQRVHRSKTNPLPRIVHQQSRSSRSSERSDAERRDEVSTSNGSHERTRKIPATLPGSPRRPEYLEIEPSKDATEDFVMDSALPDPACFCLGYNVWNYVLPPPDATSKNGMHGKKRPNRLFSVAEGLSQDGDMPNVVLNPVNHHHDHPGDYYYSARVVDL